MLLSEPSLALRKIRLAGGTPDTLLTEITLRNVLTTPQPYMPRLRATARGVFLSVPVCVQRDQIGMVVARILARGVPE